MAKLTPEQTQLIHQWAAAGATLNEIQSRLKEECDLQMTYMEARLLLIELNVQLIDQKAEEKAKAAEEPVASELDAAPEKSPAGFSMSADEIAVPGMLVSGSVTFSDGVKAKWFFDQMGRLSLKADQPGYQPSPEDVPRFQQELEQIMAKRGLY